MHSLPMQGERGLATLRQKLNTLLHAAAAGPSRFAFSAAVEEEQPKPSTVQRGKDGHISLGGGSDFFSDPMAGAAPAKSRR